MKKAPSAEVKTPEPQQKKSPDYLEIRVPRFSFQKTSMNTFLVFALVIFAFLLGMLTNKVIYLEKMNKDTAAAPTANAVAAEDSGITPPPQVVDVEAGHLPILGNNDAKVTVVIFSDFQCPFCKRYFDDSHSQLNEEYVKTGKVKLAFRHYPLTSIHPNAQKSGEAAECANEQGKFWDYHDLLFKNQEAWSQLSGEAITTAFTDYAGELSLNTEQFRTCLETDKFQQAVVDDTTAGTNVQVDGTPTFFINGYRIVGAVPYAEIKQAIEDALKK